MIRHPARPAQVFPGGKEGTASPRAWRTGRRKRRYPFVRQYGLPRIPAWMKLVIVLLFCIAAAAGWLHAGAAGKRKKEGVPVMSRPERTEKATFAGGCFWCVEAVFEQLPGVLDVVSGYIGGHKENPSYEEVCTGRTGHAEAVEIVFDPDRISYAQLLEWFWKAHDPTQLNRQGNDVGTQYRSAIFYHSEEQRRLAEESIERLSKSGKFSAPIVTQVVPAGTFYPAEDYHQDYYRKNPMAGYCLFVIRPKLEKIGLSP